MKRTLGILAVSAMLSGSVVVSTAATSSAARTYGPYSNYASCEKAKANTRAQAGQKFSACRYSKIGPGYYFTVG